MADMKPTYIVSAMYCYLGSRVKYLPAPLLYKGMIINIDIQCPIWCSGLSHYVRMWFTITLNTRAR